MEVVVCPLRSLQSVIAAHRASHLVSLLSEPEMIATPDPIRADHHLRLAVNDIVEPAENLIAPNIGHARRLIDFAAGWDRAAPMVVHCYAGISRSTAAALIILAAMARHGEERAIAEAMRAASPHASPNRLLVAHGDRALGRSGRLVRAVDAMVTPALAAEASAFSLSLPAVRLAP